MKLKTHSLLIVVSVGSLLSHCHASCPTKNVRSSSDALLHFISQRDRDLFQEVSGMPEKEGNKIFLSVKWRGHDITFAQTIQEWRKKGFNAFAAYKQKKLAPQGGFNYIELSSPKQLPGGKVQWKVSQGRAARLGLEDSYTKSLVTLSFSKSRWKIESWTVVSSITY